jgi:hypothetical protein
VKVLFNNRLCQSKKNGGNSDAILQESRLTRLQNGQVIFYAYVLFNTYKEKIYRVSSGETRVSLNETRFGSRFSCILKREVNRCLTGWHKLQISCNWNK